MDFRKTDEQELLIESIRELIERECPESYFAECDRNHEEPKHFRKVLFDNGIGLLGVPEEFGGTPVDKLTQIMVNEELSRLGAPLPHMSANLRVHTICLYGTEEQKKLTMDMIKQGEFPFALGISEPQAGSDNRAMTASATRKNGKVYINGHKTFITHATYAPYMLTCTMDQETGKMSMWWVDMKKPGIKVEYLEKIGYNTGGTSEVYLDNVEIEEKDLIGKEGEGFLQLMANFEFERLLIAASALGHAQGAFEDAAKYANQRQQFGKKIGDFQLIQEKLCIMQIKLENMRNFCYKTAWEMDNDISIRINSALCKYYCTRAAFEVADDAMQILAGVGYTLDHRVSRFWRDLRGYRLTGGTDEIMIHAAGRPLLKQYA
jgi:crotonobetainyl-CoA dehydrogenase